MSAFYYFISLLIENVFFPPLEWQRLEIVLNREKNHLHSKWFMINQLKMSFVNWATTNNLSPSLQRCYTFCLKTEETQEEPGYPFLVIFQSFAISVHWPWSLCSWQISNTADYRKPLTKKSQMYYIVENSVFAFESRILAFFRLCFGELLFDGTKRFQIVHHIVFVEHFCQKFLWQVLRTRGTGRFWGNGTKLISVPHIIDKIFSSGDVFWSLFVIFLQQDVGYLNSFLGTIAVSEEDANNSLKGPDFSPLS